MKPISCFLIVIMLVSCKNDSNKELPSGEKDAQTAIAETHNSLSDQEKAEGWVLLFDGKTTDGWHVFNNPEADPIWEAKDGILACEPINGTGEHGDLVTDKEYEDFELSFDWKITENGNSGVFFNVQEGDRYGSTWHTGPEYQLLDPTHPHFEEDPSKRSGCLYGFAPQVNEAETKPAGEWNHSRILQRNGQVEFYLNGILTGKTDFASDEWRSWVAGSSFNKFPDFSKSSKGRIALQEWSSNVWFRNIKIRELEGDAVTQ